MPPGIRPRVLDTLATTGGRPRATSTGKLSSDATPTVDESTPAPNPVASTRSASSEVTPPRG